MTCRRETDDRFRMVWPISSERRSRGPVQESCPFPMALLSLGHSRVGEQAYANLGAFDAVATPLRQDAQVFSGLQASCLLQRARVGDPNSASPR